MTTQQAEHAGAVTMHGNPLTLVGPTLAVGDKAPAFTLVTTTMQPFTLDQATENGTKSALLIVVPSLDTQTCSLETQTFHKRLGEIPAGAKAYVISVDLPFAQQRWATANEALGLTYLSDYAARAFGPAYGVLVKEISLYARATFVVKPDKTIGYVEIVKEIGDEPNYDAAFDALKG